MSAIPVPYCLKQAILRVWNDIAPDVEGVVSGTEDAVESCIDTDRLVLLAESQEAADQLQTCWNSMATLPR